MWRFESSQRHFFLLHYFMWLFFILYFLFNLSPVKAQSQAELFTQYKNDYLFQRDEYQNNYLDYLNKKNVYIQYRSITSEQDMFNSTKTVLFSRNKMLKSFLMSLRVGLDKYKNINSFNTEKIQVQLTKWEDWLDEQNLIIPNYTNSADLKNWAITFKSRYLEIQQIVYLSLTQAGINLRLYNLNEIKSLAQIIKADPKNNNFTDDWFADFPIKSDLINASLESALTIAQKPQRGKTFTNFFPEVNVQTQKADSYLRILLADLKAITIKIYN